MNSGWYIAKLVFRINGNGVSQFDEQWRLVMAPSEANAFEKASAIGNGESEQLLRPDGRTVGWEFVSVTDVFPFNAEVDGAEVFSRIEEPEHEGLYLRSVEAKSARYQVEQVAS